MWNAQLKAGNAVRGKPGCHARFPLRSCGLAKAMLKRRTRMHLSELSNDLLDDIGVDPSAARREVRRFFWD
jgi:uncharacterized protein YjiS (DUF1127 family)